MAVDPNPSYGVISLGKNNVQCDTNPSYVVVLKKYAHSVPEHSNVFSDAKDTHYVIRVHPLILHNIILNIMKQFIKLKSPYFHNALFYVNILL